MPNLNKKQLLNKRKRKFINLLNGDDLSKRNLFVIIHHPLVSSIIFLPPHEANIMAGVDAQTAVVDE
jgi:hypothetical protein